MSEINRTRDWAHWQECSDATFRRDGATLPADDEEMRPPGMDDEEAVLGWMDHPVTTSEAMHYLYPESIGAPARDNVYIRARQRTITLLRRLDRLDLISFDGKKWSST